MIHIVALSRLPSQARFDSWIFVGQGLEEREQARSALGMRPEAVGRALYETALGIRDEFRHAVGVDLGGDVEAVGWWSTQLSYRNPLTCDAFLLATWAVLVERLVEKRPDEDILLVVEDPWLFELLAKRHGKRPDVRVTGSSSLRLVFLRARSLLRGGFERARFVAHAAIEKLAFLNRASPGSDSSPDEGCLWTYLFADRGAWGSDGDLRDTYLPGIEEIARDHGRAFRRVSNVLIHPRFYSSLRRREDVTVPAEFYGWRDVWRGAFQVPPFRGRGLDVGGVPMDSLVEREWWSEVSRSWMCRNYLWFVSMRSFLSARSERDVFAYWSEQQPWEKLLCLARDSVGSNVRLVAHQHCPTASLLLNYFPDPGEWEFFPAPSHLFAMNQPSERIFVEEGYPSELVEVGGAIRYAVARRRMEAVGDRDPAEERAGSRVFVALPYGVPEARELVAALVAQAEAWASHGNTFFVRGHPDVPLSTLGIDLDALPGFDEAPGPLHEVVGAVSVLVSCNSSISLEGAALGLPVVSFLPSSALVIDPAVELIPGLITLADATELVGAVAEVSSRTAADPRSREVREEMFPEVSADAWSRVLECHGFGVAPSE